jgi:threonine aldolase
MKKILDLRSDTVSKMSRSMIEAFSRAEVGDDVYSDDPTLNHLQDHVARMFKKEKGLLTLSGTMSNLLSILVHCNRGESAILQLHGHINCYEQGNISSIAGVFPVPIEETSEGTVNFEEVRSKMLPNNEHFTKSTLLCMENTFNFLSGKALPLSFNSELVTFKSQVPIKAHLDGSRLLNAFYFHKASCPALEEHQLTEGFDSVCICLSKALRCPLGSVLVGSAEFIEKARRWRKALGGGFRQAGYLAAAALTSLQEAEKTIVKDHQNAKRLASLFAEKGVSVEKSDTNFVVFQPHLPGTQGEYLKRLKNVGILAGPRLDGRIRLVLHENITEDDVDQVVSRIFSKEF